MPSRRAAAWGAVAVAVVLAAGLALALWRAWAVRERPAPPEAAPDTTQAGVRSATLWFADPQGDSLVSEPRPLVEVEGLHERIAALVEALERGSNRQALEPLPPGTEVLHAYLDDQGLLVLDLSSPFQQGFHGGSRAEALAVGALVRTVASNVPGVQRVLLTCGGVPIASLGGHVPLDRPLDVRDWY